MMFNFNTFNHCHQGQIILEDITGIMGAQLDALGHETHFSDMFIPRDWGYNVIIESFADDPATLEKIGAAYAEGYRFIYIATEEPTGNGFNHGLEPAMIDRQNAFPAAAKFCDGILHLVPGKHITHWYRQFAPAAYAELGYAPSFVTADDTEPHIPFGFYGKMTWRREQMLSRLDQLCGEPVLRLTTLDTPRLERDAIMRNVCVIVQIRANEEWAMVSSSRCATALSMGRPVIAEPHPKGQPWNQVVHFSESVESFYEDAVAATRHWRAIHFAQMARFKEVLPPDVCLLYALRQIGIL